MLEPETAVGRSKIQKDPESCPAGADISTLQHGGHEIGRGTAQLGLRSVTLTSENPQPP